jgi:hypothetical protein
MIPENKAYRGVRPIPFDLLTSIFDRPPVTRAPANDRPEPDPYGGTLGKAIMLAVACLLGFIAVGGSF